MASGLFEDECSAEATAYRETIHALFFGPVGAKLKPAVAYQSTLVRRY